jgi:signal transduction histidine kinase
VTAPAHVLLHPKRSIAGRVMLLVAVGSLTTMSLVGLVSWSELRRADRSIVGEHEAVAASAARQVDRQLALVLSEIQSLANDSRAFEPLPAHQPELAERALKAWLAAESLEGLFVATLDGAVQARVPAGQPLGDRCVVEAVARIQASPRPAVTGGIDSPDAGRRLLVLVPVRSWQGALLGVAAGELAPGGKRFRLLTEALASAPVGHLDLVDEAGVRLGPSDLHRSPLGPGPVVATAPLTLAPWRIVSHRTDGPVAPGGRLVAMLVWLGPLLVAGALLLAWGAAWSVRRPLLKLTDAAERLADGDLATPVAIEGQDEVGQLGRTFESMRRALRASREQIEQANAVLEQRVEARTRELERLNRELQERERVRQSLLRKVITAQEDERKVIARELHDDACQTVTALGLRLDTALAGVEPGTAAHADLSRARELASRSLDELHRLMHDLRPALLDDMGLVAAIRWYGERRLAPKGLAVRFESSVSALRLPVELETAVVRAVQEALTNVERHARASMVLIEVSIARGQLAIDVEDDGIGFDPASVVPRPGSARGLGLLGIRERMELAGGSAIIDSSPGNGTRVAIRLPLPEGAVDAEDPSADR